MLGLQRLFYGPLRPIEIEQLYEKAWFAITETCLAMTIFRDEVGGWFLVMFVCLLIGKVWGWIGEGRVEILEQQPPADPRLFHARLSISLAISVLFDVFLLRYSVQTVLLQARPNMMVMFAFEFAVLSVTSLSTAARYLVSLHESAVIRNQINARRAQIIQDRRRNLLATSEPNQLNPRSEDGIAEVEIDAVDIDVPGWEDKGRWIFYLDLATGKTPQPKSYELANSQLPDFFKLILYLTFFSVLCMFYGMPIHIIRDVAMTIRSFYKRINDFVRYRQATRDMNARYPDATANEISGEDVCIICRENMNPWQPSGGDESQQADGNNALISIPLDERLRPKRLPCGHILHFACLRSWLERQQNCPTCRAPVLSSGAVVSNSVPLNQPARGQPQIQQAQGARQDVQRPQNVFNFGPFRLAFGRQGFAQPANNPPNQQGPAVDMGSALRIFRQAPATNQRTAANLTQPNVQFQLHHLEQQLMQEINDLHAQTDQLSLVRALQGELVRLRAIRANPGTSTTRPLPVTNHDEPGSQFLHGRLQFAPAPVLGFAPERQDGANQSLPDGMTIPDGWSVLPLGRLTNGNTTSSIASSTNLAQTSDLVPRRSIYDLMSQTSLPSPMNSQVVHQPNDPLNRDTSTGQENAPSSLQSGLNGLVDHDALRTGQNLESGDQGASPNEQQPARMPRWTALATNPNEDQEKNITSENRERTVPQSSLETQVEVSGDEEEDGIPAESSQAKGKGKAATVEDYIEDVD